eukprot:TRINITY_DN2223_c0_g4_i1.p1 TRINITY_DN2223_c0_g4~~TRINITY_DN2223_c0_g4_i1.p1  ORF type:complete len:473 (+),score=102.25 TRINITY_DN2223_c0_g4_i1:36-1454(+)
MGDGKRKNEEETDAEGEPPQAGAMAAFPSILFVLVSTVLVGKAIATAATGGADHVAAVRLPAADLEVPAAEDFDGTVVRRPAIVVYMSTRPSNPYTPGYVTASFVWMSLYAVKHNIRFNYYVAPAAEPPDPGPGMPPGCGPKETCRHGKDFCHKRTVVAADGKCLLSPVWGKVKAVVAAMHDPDPPSYVIQLDTDAIVRYEDFTTHFSVFMAKALNDRGLNFEAKPFIANQEQPTWWCNVELKGKNNTPPHHLKYKWCLNTGVFVVNNNNAGRRAVEHWWASALDSYDDDPLKFEFRENWPWEQGRLEVITNDPARKDVFDLFTALPDANLYTMANAGDWEKRPGECLGGPPRWRCLINHYSVNKEMKQYWGNRTLHAALTLLHGCATGADNITMSHPSGGHEAVKPAYPWTVTFPLDWCLDVHRRLNVPLPPQDADFFNKQTVPYEAYEPWHKMLYAAAKALEPRHVKMLA